MSYIEKELTDGERLVLMGHVSWWTIVPRTLLAIAVFVAATVVAGMLAALGAVFWLVAVPVVLLLWLIMVARLIFRVLTTEIAITNRRVISKAGLFNTQIKATPLDKVNNVNVTQSFFGNMLNYGDIEVTTATAEESDNHLIMSLAHTDEFRNTLTGMTIE
ncbi:MAG TPA: PH domain-containing protein [Coriobacteriia bacterium]|nr:PH domain-containing protein [Coriobacteriia bacterium]